MIPRIFARNLTARALQQVAGNPVTTRLESGVGNCFPGLEFDHRNLDRRFFPGLVFEFTGRGIRLLHVDLDDPALGSEPALKRMLSGETGSQLKTGRHWVVRHIAQGGTSISMTRDGGGEFDATTTWRLVRCLQPGKVTIQLQKRAERPREVFTGKIINLSANRRNYVNPQTGVIDSAYAPGELTQSLCSPWMHDFRDCACFYWASNHPDIVLAQDPPGEPTLPSGAPEDPMLALTPIDWLREDRTSTKPAAGTDDGNRPGQMDHYEINTRWQELAIVLQGREISSVFQPERDDANPLADPDALAAKLVELGTLEHAVALEYLYARYSLKDPDEVRDSSLKDALTFAQHEIFLVAVSEMRHLRWVNQLIWSLEHAGLLRSNPGPSLGVATQIPVASDPSRPVQLPPAKGKAKFRKPQLRPLLPDVLTDFITVEQPSGFLDGQYSHVLATLREKEYGPTLEQLAARIIADGMEHFTRFRQVQVILKGHEPKDYLYSLDFKPAVKGNAEGTAALDIYEEILDGLTEAYASGDMEDASHIAKARGLMFDLDLKARNLAKRGVGVPFLSAKKRP